MRLGNSLTGLVAVLVACALACNSHGFSNESRKEFWELERALGTLASADPEDRMIRLKEIEEVEVHDARINELKKLCMEAYRTFGQSTELLAEARAKTQKVELKMAEARTLRDAGGKIPDEEALKLDKMGREAGASLRAVNQSLDRAEKLVNSCEKKRGVLRELATQR